MFTRGNILIQLWQRNSYSRTLFHTKKALLCEVNEEKASKEGGYAKAFKRFEANLQPKPQENQSFNKLLRYSKFVDLGDPQGKVVTGKIFHIVDDDLYIDFGWKFHCVCPRPQKQASNYVRGTRVRLLIKDLELSSKFLGYEKDLTLLEADCILLGIAQDRSQSQTTNQEVQSV